MKINSPYRAGAGLAVAAALLVLWMQAAVATEDDSPGLLLLGVLVVGIMGALIARFRPQGMARALFATALAQALVAVIAMIAWQFECQFHTGTVAPGTPSNKRLHPTAA